MSFIVERRPKRRIFPPTRKTGEDVKAKVEARMSKIDALSPDLRELVHEFGWQVVKQFTEHGVTNARTIKHLVHIVLNEVSTIYQVERDNRRLRGHEQGQERTK